LNSSIEWLQALDAGHRKDQARHVLMLSQAVAAMFDKDQWREMQSRLVDEL
jgi:hypothetical protein